MKNFVTSIILCFGLICVYSCSKKNGNQSPPSNSNPQPTVTNFSVNGVAANSPNPSAAAIGSNYIIGATDNVYYYPQLQIAFSGTYAPVSGSYSIVRTPTGPFQCSFALATSSTVTASSVSGVVNISTAATPNNTASFTSIVCTATGTTTASYTVSGTIKY